MPTTSNFGWTTPADTDLVKDGAAAIRTLGNGIDTSLVDLKGGTTGQILSKTSNTDLDYTWVTPNVGDITEVQAGTGISVASGTGPIPVVTNTVATAFDAKGDLIVGTGADTFAKLAVGTNDYVLTAASGEATGLKWAAPAASDSMTLINTGGTTLSGATTSITSIPGTYKYLYGVIVNWLPATDNVHLRWRFNGDSTANRYKYDSGLVNFANSAFDDTGLYLGQQSDNGTSNSISVFYVYDYANTTTWKMAIGYTAVNNPTTSSNINFMATVGLYNQTGAITEINFFPGSGNFTSGTVYLYGVK